MTNAAHLAEHSLAELRETPAEKRAWDTARLLSDLAAVEAEMTRYVTTNHDVLGRGASVQEQAFVPSELPPEQARLIMGLARQAASTQPGDAAARLHEALMPLATTPLGEVVADAATTLTTAAQALDKPVPKVACVGDTMRLDADVALALRNALGHMLLNSLDHGIESPEQRVAKGKQEAGLIQVSVAGDAPNACLILQDDGRGLNMPALRQRAKALHGNEADAQDPLNVASTIFKPGISTAAGLTQVSGRGVGMDAAKEFLRSVGGDVNVRLTDAPSEIDLDGFAHFELVINLPSRSLAEA
jgi:two-component system chemotaxis sensor kinase CheA